MWARKSHGAIRGWLVWQHILHNILCFDPNVHGCVGEFATLKHSEYFTTCVLCTVHDVTCARRLYGETTIELAPKPRFSSCGYKQWHGAHINLKCSLYWGFVSAAVTTTTPFTSEIEIIIFYRRQSAPKIRRVVESEVVGCDHCSILQLDANAQSRNGTPMSRDGCKWNNNISTLNWIRDVTIANLEGISGLALD